MALAATRCLDSLWSCSSVLDSSCGMAASAPTCICIFTCFCFATGESLADGLRGAGRGVTGPHDHRNHRRRLCDPANPRLPRAAALEWAAARRGPHAGGRPEGRGQGARADWPLLFQVLWDLAEGHEQERVDGPPCSGEVPALGAQRAISFL